MKIEVSIDEIERLLISFNVSHDNTFKSYMTSYPEFVSYFQKLSKEITKHEMIIGINFVYGWMPTILKNIDDSYFKECLKILNKAKGQKTLDSNDFEMLKKTFNNSIVGTSKLLHFINPEKYPIWDSNVCRFLFKKNIEVNRVCLYEKYLNWSNEIILSDIFEDIHMKIIKKVGSPVSKMRAIELLCFFTGRITQNEINK